MGKSPFLTAVKSRNGRELQFPNGAETVGFLTAFLIWNALFLVGERKR